MQVAIVGYGIEGRSALHYWQDQGAVVTVCDQDIAKEVPAGVPTQLGSDYLHSLGRFDVIIRSAGIPLQTILANNPGIEAKVTTVINEFLDVCPTRNVIGITGTKGKGTTATLTALMLEAAGYKVFLAGNIGQSPLELLSQITPESWVVLELSSFQLSDIAHSPTIAACLMVEPEHLNWHNSLNEYTAAKSRLFAHQKPTDTAIYFADSETSHAIASSSLGKKIPYYASPGAYVDGDAIKIDDTTLCKTSELQLIGRHNWQNACAAATIVWQVAQLPDAIRSVLTSFAGLPHRLELIREFDGVYYFNDSFASAPPATEAAIRAIPNKKVLIVGGFDRQLPLGQLAKTIKAQADTIRAILLIGRSASRLAEQLRDVGFNDIYLSTATDMSTIVAEAKQLAKSGDSVVLSPGFPSFDMFKNFEDRGLQFKHAVGAL
jgi:UDP-N-acetylmuramoylalanine--D-glutamate ligase